MPDGQFKEGIAGGRLAPRTYAENFADLHPPLDHHEALVESDRCYFCYDAPCMNACPTSIDIPLFIRQIVDRQSDRRRQDHLRPEHPGRHVRPRLPDRDAVRGSLRARSGGRQAGQDRPAAALRHRHRDGARTSSSMSGRRRRAKKSPSSAPGRPASPRRTGSRITAMRSPSSRRAQRPAASTNMASPPTRPSMISPRPKSTTSPPIGGIADRERQGAWQRPPARRSAPRL